MKNRQVVLFAVSSFTLILAALLRFQVYPDSALHPREPYPSTTHLAADRAVYFDWARLRLHTGEPVHRTVVLQAGSFEGDDETSVWTELATTSDRNGARIAYQERRVAFDRRTGLAKDCCEGYVGTRSDIRQNGLAFRWPVDARPVAYPFFDPVTLSDARMRYTGEETLRGLRVYRYEQDTPPVKIEDVADPLPGSLVGFPGRAVRVVKYAQSSRVYWVEPRSGLPVKVEEYARETLRTPDDQERLVTFEARLRTVDGDVAMLVDAAATFAARARMIETIIPAILAGLGLLSLIAVVLPGRRGRSTAAQDQQEVPGDDLPEAGEADHGARPARVVAGKRVDDLDV
ncbi:hypothetical protein GCM10010156_43120 [Planobispora rosea]|uniref:DUF3068 domain-containing protein n=1 Tax=Planobispora rosea TaxID=35762 RepID=A0A8J3WE46_PLARO|nr:hypothetical protein GCM10010156_43120 [Planobispora rosea]GIH85833.1 hypothetical protein Pro02_42410 [Planobispora rosea]